MAWQQLFPALAGGVLPESDTLTLIAEIQPGANIYGSVFLANVSVSTIDRVRLLIKPALEPAIDDKHYLLWDAIVHPNQFLQLANIALNEGDQVIGRSEFGLVAFNVTGDRIVNNL
jgi:hypothetical protein